MWLSWHPVPMAFGREEKNVPISVFLVETVELPRHGFAFINPQIVGLYLLHWFHFEYRLSTGGHHVVAAIPETPQFPDFAAERSFRHDCTADQCDVGLRSKISNNICLANNRKGVHSKIKLFVAAWPPTLDGMTVEQRNSLPGCAVGESPPRRREPPCCDLPAR